MEKLEFGYRCQDIITGFEGVVTTRGTFITGCDRVELTKGVQKEDKQWFDVPTLEVVDKSTYEKLQKIDCNKYDDISEAKYDFGTHAKDRLTGYEGVIVGKSISINGDISYGLSPQYDKISRDNNASWFDESRIDVIEYKKEIVENSPKRTGGAVPSLKIR